eukprot:Nk52_evm11s165 gene=Nk52_evmTU11s165
MTDLNQSTTSENSDNNLLSDSQSLTSTEDACELPTLQAMQSKEIIITIPKASKDIPESKLQPRYEYLDGLRGFACFVVVLDHWEALLHASARSSYKYWGMFTPMDGLTRGIFAVRIFFVLSGFVLSAPLVKGFARGHYTQTVGKIARMSVARFPRLAIPAIIAYYIAYIQYASRMVGWNPNNVDSEVFHQAAKTPSFFAVVSQSLWGLWNREDSMPGNVGLMNNAMWTLPVELRGSFVVFLFALVLSHVRSACPRRAFLLGTFYLCSDWFAWCLPFLGGVWLAQVKHEGMIHRWAEYVKQRKWLSILLPVLFPILMWPGRKFGSDMYMVGSFNTPLPVGEYWMSFLATVMVIMIMLSSHLIKFFDSAFMQFIGRISFSVYLLHFPMIYSIGRPLIGLLYPLVGGWNVAMWISLPIFLSVVILAAWGYYHLIEKRSPLWAKKFAGWILK